MDHVLKALDEHIAHQDWLLKCARLEIDELKAELEKAKAWPAMTREEYDRKVDEHADTQP